MTGLASRPRSFGACVRAKAREEAREEQTADTNASKECKAERAREAQAFLDEYGTGPNRRNAHGKCVSRRSSAKEAEADQQDQEEATALTNAAKERAAEREAGPRGFNEQYGRDANDPNAFGTCVSEKARENEADQPTEA